MKILSRNDARNAGLAHYFTGKPCRNGHVDVRYVSSHGCKTCCTEQHRQYRKDDGFREREAAYKAAYREQNREKTREYAHWYWRNHPSAKAVNAASKARRREEINRRQSAANHTPEQAEKAKAHRRRMYEKFREDRLARAKAARGIRKGAEGKFTQHDIERILTLQKGRCAECRKPLNGVYHVDHIMPLSKGGSNWPKNLQCLCPRCNLSKNAKHPLDWARQNGRLL